MAIIDIKDLTFIYPNQDKPALDNISLEIQQGEFVVICGSSGCGKTTLLNMLKPSLAPNGKKSGHISFLNQPITSFEEKTLASDIGFVMQNPESQIVTDKVWHELVFGLENMGVPSQVMRRRVGEMSSFFGIQQLFRKNTADLSGGQKQLVNLASVLVMDPKILILDEPTSQLDPIAASEFIQTLHKLNLELGLTIIIVEHRLEDVFPLADKVVVMDSGEVVLVDSPRKVGESIHLNQRAKKMEKGLPSAVRIYNGLNHTGVCPLTIKEGKDYLNKYYLPLPMSFSERVSEKISSAEAVIDLKDVCFKYERNLPDILYKVNLRIKKGEIFSMLGGNGVGKSTLLSVISGQRKAYKGKVKINQKLIKKYKDNELYRQNLAFLPQNPQLLFIQPTIREDYEEIAKSVGYSKEETERLIQENLKKMGIIHLIDQHPYDLSGGEQQKAALGKILLLKPKILLLDEPTKGMDAFSKESFGQILKELKDEGVTILMVTHDVEFAAEYSDRCGLFFDREVISTDQTIEFFANNTFYTTASNRIAKQLYPEAITTNQVIACAKESVASTS